jgi:integrase
LTKHRQVIQQSRQTRKEETGAVVIQFSDLRAEGHYRYNRIVRLRQAYLDAVKEIHHRQAQGETDIFPFAFSYEEGSAPEHGVPAQERLSFRVWNRRSFVLAHRESYKTGAYYYYKNRYYEKHPSRPPVGETQLLLEFVKADRLNDDAPPESLWFLELFELDVMGGHPLSGSDEEIAAKKQWFQAWGYLDEDQDEEIGPFDAHAPGVLNWSREDGTDHFVRQARKKTGSLFLPIEALYAAATFGVLSVDVFTTTGMRMNEILQLRLTPDCFVRLQMPAPPGAKDQSPRIRYAFRLLPKGEKTETLHDYFIGEETKRLLVKVARTLAEHYNLRAGEVLPTVAYSPNYSREHRFEAAPYLLQYNRQALPGEAITACLRFLLHGMIFRTRDAKPVILKAHLLRHAFATFAVQVEKIPLDIVGALLKQKNLDVTDYYSQPTESMVAEAHDLYLARSALHLNVGEALRRSPEELQRLYKEAEGKAGTLADVIGGQCICHGFCAAKFACVGCAGKVPDPAKRGQLERHRAWAMQQVEYATQEGLFPEAERMRQVVRDCDTELREIDQIEAYRRDEGHAAIIQIEPRKRR